MRRLPGVLGLLSILSTLVATSLSAATVDAMQITVTGTPASAEFLGAVLVSHGLAVPDKLPPLLPGQHLVVSGAVLTNRPLPELPPVVLGFSDHPEKIADTGVLFWGGVLTWRPVRLQYYHEGAPGQSSHILSLFMDNPTSSPVTIHVISGSAGPCLHPIDAGHASGHEFLKRMVANEGEIVRLAPGENREMFRHSLPAQQTVSGLVQMTLLTAGQVHYHVVSRHSATDPVSFPTVDNPSDVHTKGAFTITDIQAIRSYRAGAPENWISIGNHAPENVLTGKALAGDYGITYSVTIKLHNDGEAPAVVGVYFQPRGGSATGTFIIDGRIVDAGLTPAKGLRTLASYRVPPHRDIVTHILTIPEGASSYPVRLLCRTIRVQ